MPDVMEDFVTGETVIHQGAEHIVRGMLGARDRYDVTKSRDDGPLILVERVKDAVLYWVSPDELEKLKSDAR